ncbi:hypothetical protein I79_019557 [Cricetulus griseus]|uniref:Uncharacterized protein n=1 Tax=Cricetulus griseus TaxID=10029 RepID=G3I7R0_CRIGR|nr:hypothetical protein I79_019557 [Cricetulus griseus]
MKFLLHMAHLQDFLGFFCFCFSRQGFSVLLWSLSWNLICRPGWPQNHRDLPASASQVLGLKVWATNAQPTYRYFVPEQTCTWILSGQHEPQYTVLRTHGRPNSL